MPMEDVWDQQVITEVIRRNIEEETQSNAVGGGENRNFFGQRIAPLVPVQSRVARVRVADVLPYGLGQFKALEATPPLYKPKPTLREYVVELESLEEMERFTPTEWMRLNSNDPAIARGAMISLVDRLRNLQMRNEKLTEWMRWQAFKGTLVITYKSGGQRTIDYGMPGSHLPSAGVAWTDQVNSDPIADLYAWSQIGADDAGEYYSIVHLNSVTWRLIQFNQKIRSYLSALGRQVMLPTRADLQALMREGTGNFEIIDAGYLPEGATNRRLTKFIPDNRALLTTGYNLFGTPLADVADGQVLIGGDGNTAPDIAQGAQSEIMTNPMSKVVFRRQASARIPRIHFIEAFAYATLGA